MIWPHHLRAHRCVALQLQRPVQALRRDDRPHVPHREKRPSHNKGKPMPYHPSSATTRFKCCSHPPDPQASLHLGKADPPAAQRHGPQLSGWKRDCAPSNRRAVSRGALARPNSRCTPSLYSYEPEAQPIVITITITELQQAAKEARE